MILPEILNCGRLWNLGNRINSNCLKYGTIRQEVLLAGNLRDRLLFIRQAKKAVAAKPAINETNINNFPGWVKISDLVLKREIIFPENFILPKDMPSAAPVVMPGIRTGCNYSELLFFDLETTGLSGGAGTVAFLAAFGRFIKTNAAYRLHICQYLLLDYPGECDLIEALLNEIKNDSTIISYNGKNFDSQILANRFLMNGVRPPEYQHADLLYPARRLWKKILPNCSQGTIETEILGIDRSGDIPGAMAPDIWFSFLRDGNPVPLLGICDHNRRDISGLASIFQAIASIAENPVKSIETIRFDIETLAIKWHEASIACEYFQHLYDRGRSLLLHAAEKNYPRAQLRYALTLLREGNYGERRDWLLKAASAGQRQPPEIQAKALRFLSIDSERRLKNCKEALKFAEQGMSLLPVESGLKKDYERRILRLKEK